MAELDSRIEMRPDVTISQLHPLPREVPGPALTLDREPVPMRVTLLDEETESYLQIHHLEENALIPILELLSPTNKEGAGRGTYLRKLNLSKNGGE